VSALARVAGRRSVALVGGVRVPSYLVMLYAGCLCGIATGAAVAHAEGLDASRFALATTLLLVPAFAGARLWFVLLQRDLFRSGGARVWKRGDGGASLYGGLLAGIAASVPVLAVAGLGFRSFWDAASVTMLVGLIFTRLGCLMNGCCAGRATNGPLGMTLPDHRGDWLRRYPTQLLEAAFAGIALAAALALRASAGPGDVFAAVVASYAAVRLALEPTRAPEHRAPGNVIVSIALLAAAVALLAT
jgi:phosphatidylglycerol---prolipoprotein diacylglyceryl transferase